MDDNELGLPIIFSSGLMPWVHCLFIWLNAIGTLPFHWLHCHGLIAFSVDLIPWVHCHFIWLNAMGTLPFHLA